MKLKLVLITASLECFLALGGCGLRVTNQPPQTPRVKFANSLLAAADVVDLIAQGINAANSELVTLNTSGSITLPEYIEAHSYLVSIANDNDKAIAVIHAAQLGSTAADWRASIVTIADNASKQDPSKFGIHDANARATFLLSLATLKAALTVIPQSFGKPTTTASLTHLNLDVNGDEI